MTRRKYARLTEADMKWPHELFERDHEVQNPTSPEKIRLLGEYVRLTSETRVLDVACGQAGPAMILAEAYGCSVLGLELRAGFAREARRRTKVMGLEGRIKIRTCDASTISLDPATSDVALCLGASFVWGNIADAAAALAPAVRAGGFVAVGEPFWRHWPLPEWVDPQNFVPLAETVERF
jgi:ubiquinone/menaquinone biosynthesis C-methylase UbiE